MKKLWPILFIAVLVAGCRTSYDLTLNTGTKITGVTKPVLNKETGQYVFKDANGRPGAVPAMRVRAIEPHQEEEQNDFYRATQTRGPK